MQVMLMGGPLDSAITTLPLDQKAIRYTIEGSENDLVHEYVLDGEPENDSGVNIAAFVYRGIVESAPTLTLAWTG